MAVEDKIAATIVRLRQFAERYAEKSGFAVQPDPAQFNYILNGLAQNLLKYGKPYCPCREVTGDLQKDRLNICPCRTHREEIAQMGECECGLYVRRRDNPEKGKE